MTIEQAKKAILQRYNYLYDNAHLLLAPFMCDETEEEFQLHKKEYQEKYNLNYDKPMVYLNIKPLDKINIMFEEFLLSDKLLEETSLYQMLESKKEDCDYLKKVRIGMEKVSKNYHGNPELIKVSLGIGNILCKVCEYIDEQSNELNNRDYKLQVMDEYFRLLRYNNKGKVLYSGRNLSLKDISFLPGKVDRNLKIPLKNNKDVIVNDFIMTIVNAPYYENNWSIFTEKEKQEVYLMYHDELPCDLEIKCQLEGNDDLISENDNSCGESFIIKEQEIFVRKYNSLINYYQICPHCGFVVNIPEKLLSDGIKLRIEKRCQKEVLSSSNVRKRKNIITTH